MKIFSSIIFACITLWFSACQTSSTSNLSPELLELREKALAGDVESQYLLGEAYEYGEGVAVDEKEALRWYMMGAKAGHGTCLDAMGYFYDLAMGGLEENDELALAYYTKSMKAGDEWGTNDLAWFLATCKDASLRDPQRAYEIMKAYPRSFTMDDIHYDTYAATLAAVGKFREAAVVQKMAIRLVMQSGYDEFIAEYKERLALYQNEQVFIDRD